MPDLRFFVIPAALLGASVAYVVANPSGAAVEPEATETPTSTARPAAAPTATATPVALADQLPGLTGRLTYQSIRGYVTVEFPSGLAVDSPEIAPSTGGSDDGLWQDQVDCVDGGGCTVRIFTRDGRTTQLDGSYFVTDTAWRPGTHALAIAVAPSETAAHAKQIIVVDDASDPQTRVAYDASDGEIEAFAWYGEELLVAYGDGANTWLHLASAGEPPREVALLRARVPYFYPSPDGRTFAFTQSDAAGWRLMTLDAQTLATTDHGPMGSDGPDAVPVTSSPENTGKGGPMYIAWSRDGAKLAFGGGFDPPYTMTVVDLQTSAVAATEFPAGYPGEIRWNAAGTEVAVSTYDTERKHHETWVVDAATGAGRHLMDGCIIVWSPDDRFLAVHGEDIIGISIVDVQTGARMRLTQAPEDAPLLWTQ